MGRSRSIYIGALLGSAAIVLAGCSGASQSTAENLPTSIPESLDASGEELTVWVMQDDYNEETVDAMVAEFTERTGATVDVQIQQWDGIQNKVSTALATANAPDVVDMGNTQVSSFASNGGLFDLTPWKNDLAQGQTWLTGLAEPAYVGDSLFAVPGFAGTRAVIFNKDVWAQAGVTEEPQTWDELIASLDAVKAANPDPSFSTVLLPGSFWHFGAQFLWDAGADFAVNDDGTWTGAVDNENGIAGLESWVDFQNTYSAETSRTLMLENSNFFQSFADGKASAVIGTPGLLGQIVADSGIPEESIGTFAMPSQYGDGTQPVFLGGADWGIAARSDQKELALVWLQITGSEDIQVDYVAGSNGWIPNSEENIAATADSIPEARQAFSQAALNSKATPASPGWGEIEQLKAMEEVFMDVASGAATPEEAAKQFDSLINDRLN